MRFGAVFALVVLAFAAGVGMMAFVADGEREPHAAPVAVAAPAAQAPRAGERIRSVPPPASGPIDLDLRERLLALPDVASEFDQSAGLYALLAPLDVDALVGLLDYSEIAFAGADYVGATRVIIGRIAEFDPDRAIALAERAIGSTRPEWLASIFHALARIDLDDARARAEKLPALLRPGVAQALIRSRDDLSLAEQATIANSLGLRHVPVGAIQDYGVAWTQAKEMRSPNGRVQRLMQILNQWSEVDPRAALQAAQSERGQFAHHLVSQVVSRWVRREPDAALGWLHAQSWNARTSPQHFQSVYANLAQQDPEAALMWAQTLSGEQRGAALLGVLPQLATLRPEVAFDALDELEGQQRQQLLQQVAMNAAMADPGSLDQVLDRVQGEERDQLLSMAVSMMVHQDPEAAIARLDEVADEDTRQSLARRVVGQWSQQDLDAAVTWVERESADNRPALYQGIAQQWTHNDVEAAYAFARSLSDRDERDAALVGAMNGAYNDADLARRMYDDIGGEEARQGGAWALFNALRNADPAAAERFRLEEGLEAPQPQTRRRGTSTALRITP